MENQTLDERVETLEDQVSRLVDMIFALSEVLEEKGIATKDEVMSSANKIREERFSGVEHDDRERERKKGGGQ